MLIPEDGSLRKITRSGLSPFNNVMIIKVPEKCRKPGETIYQLATLDHSKKCEKWPADKYLDPNSIVEDSNVSEPNEVECNANNKSETVKAHYGNEKNLFHQRQLSKAALVARKSAIESGTNPEIDFNPRIPNTRFHSNMHVPNVWLPSNQMGLAGNHIEPPILDMSVQNTREKPRNNGRGLLGDRPISYGHQNILNVGPFSQSKTTENKNFESYHNYNDGPFSKSTTVKMPFYEPNQSYKVGHFSQPKAVEMPLNEPNPTYSAEHFSQSKAPKIQSYKPNHTYSGGHFNQHKGLEIRPYDSNHTYDTSYNDIPNNVHSVYSFNDRFVNPDESNPEFYNTNYKRRNRERGNSTNYNRRFNMNNYDGKCQPFEKERNWNKRHEPNFNEPFGKPDDISRRDNFTNRNQNRFRRGNKSRNSFQNNRKMRGRGNYQRTS